MSHYWLCEIKSGRLLEHLESEEDMDGLVFASKGCSEEQRWMLVPIELHWSNVKVYENLADPENPVYSLIEDVAKESPEWNVLRIKRNEILKEADWTQLADSPLSIEDKADWASYRQYLRDIPQNEADAEYDIMDFDSWLAEQE